MERIPTYKAIEWKWKIMNKEKVKSLTISILPAMIFAISIAVLLRELIKCHNLKNKIERDRDTKKHQFEFTLLWLHSQQNGYRVIDYFHKNNYRNIAIYGLAGLGLCLYDELQFTDVKVDYCIDRNSHDVYADVGVYSPEDELPETDIIVVSAIHYFDEIKHVLDKKVQCPVVSLEKIVHLM